MALRGFPDLEDLLKQAAALAEEIIANPDLHSSENLRYQTLEAELMSIERAFVESDGVARFAQATETFLNVAYPWAEE